MGDEVVTGVQVQVGLDSGKFEASGVRLTARAKAITEAFNSISGLKADQKLQEVERAVEKLGGVANLSVPQVARLRGELEKLSAAGVKIPQSLKLPKLDSSGIGKIGEAFNAQALTGIQSQVASLGPLGGILSAIGPAGLAAGAGIAIVGGAMGAAAAMAADLIKGLAETASRLTDISSKTKLSTGFLQEIEFAGKLVGVSLDDISSSAVKLSANIGQGDKIFGQLGLSLEKLQTLNADQQFEAVAAAIASIKDPTIQAAAAIEAFGKGGTALLPLIRSDMEGAREEARRLGIVLGSDLIAAGDALDDNLSKVKLQLDALKNVLAGELVKGGGLEGGLTAISEILSGLIAIMPTFVTGVKGLTSALAATVPGLSGLLSLGGLGLDKLREVGRLAGSAKSVAAPGVSAKTGAVTFDPAVEKAAAAAKKLGEERKKAAEEAKRAEEVYTKAVVDGMKQQFDAFSKLREAREKSSLALESKLTGGASEANLQSAQLQAQIIDSLGVKAQDAAGKLRPVGEVLAEINTKLGEFGSTLSAGELENLVEAFDKLRKAGADIPQGLGAISDRLNQMAIDDFTAKVKEAEEQAYQFARALAEMGAFGGFSVGDVDAMFGRLPQDIGKVKEATIDWHQKLQDLANLAQTLPGIFGKALGGILSGVAGIGSAITGLKKDFGKGAGGIGGALTGKQGIGGLLGSLSGIGAIAGAAFGIGKTIIGLFKGDPVKKAQKEIAKTLGRGISKEFAQQALELSKSLGISLSAAAKQLEKQGLLDKLSDLQSKRGAAVGQIQAGLAGFGAIKGAASAQGRIFGAQFAAVVKAEGFQKALELFKETFSKLPEDIKAAVPAEIQKLFAFGANEQFAGAIDGIAAMAEGFKGLVALTGVSSQLLADYGAVAQASFDQAKAGAIEAGATQEEAQRAALQAVIPLLSEMQTAAMQTGQALDPVTQGLIDAAKAAGIEIPVDPLLQVVNVLKEIEDVLRQIGGLTVNPKVNVTTTTTGPVPVPQPGGGGGKIPGLAVGGIGRFDKRGTPAVLHGIEAILPLDNERAFKRVMMDVAHIRPDLFAEALGRIVKPAIRQNPHFASGGFVPTAPTDTGGGGFGGLSSPGGGSISISAPVSVFMQVEATGDAQSIGESVAAAFDAEIPVLMDAQARMLRREIHP